MTSSFLFQLTFLWFGLILAVKCVYNPYLYDDTHDSEEHCCLVRVRNRLCKATPMTRSLIHVTKQCARFGRKNRDNDYLDRITRRLNVEKVYENDEKIFIELQKPLKQNILENDLVCLKSNQENRINFEKCYIELVDNRIEDRKQSRNIIEFKNRMFNMILEQRKHRVYDQSIKRPLNKSDEENDDGHEINGKHDEKKEIHRIKLNEPIRIREGRGLSILKHYQIKPDQIRPKTSEQRQCWSWYRDRTRKIRRNPSKSSKICISLNIRREQCLNQLIHNSIKAIEPIKHSFLIDSKLFCKTKSNHDKFLGHFKNAEICFEQDDQIYIEYKFHDIAHLSDQYKNNATLTFLYNNKKFRAEFEDDCLGKHNLMEVSEPETSTSSIYFERN